MFSLQVALLYLRLHTYRDLLHDWKKLEQKITARNKYVKTHADVQRLIYTLPRMRLTASDIPDIFEDTSDGLLTKRQSLDLRLMHFSMVGDFTTYYIMRGFHLWKQIKEDSFQTNETLVLLH